MHIPFLIRLLCAVACASLAHTASADIRLHKVARPAFETEANLDDDAGGRANADDPAIWAHPSQPQHSLILGTLKEGGLGVYSLRGKTLQRIAAPVSAPDDAPGRFNNVDIVAGFALNGRKIDIAVVTDRGQDRLRIYRINPDHARGGAPLTDITDPAAPFVFNTTQAEVNDQRTAYGLAVAMLDGKAIAMVSQRERSRLAKLQLLPTAGGKVSYRLLHTLDMPSQFALPGGTSWTPCQDEDGVLPQFEGMVIDQRRGILYAAQEQVGVWKIALGSPQQRQLVDRVRNFGAPYTREWDPEEEEYVCSYGASAHGGNALSADAEGLTIAYGKRGRALLFASSQGDNRFAVYDIERGHRLLGIFRVGRQAGIDGVQHSDGAAVYTRALGPQFPHGLLVVHDGENLPDRLDEEGEVRENTNFKLVPLQTVLEWKD